MASRTGIVLTAGILAAVTAASFVFWLIPESPDATFVVTEYGEYLDGVINIHEVLESSISLEYASMMRGDTTPQEYSRMADATSSQVTAQISELITAKPPEEWLSSYISYMESMKAFNGYILETKVVAGLIEEDAKQDEIDEAAERVDDMRDRYEELARASGASRP